MRFHRAGLLASIAFSFATCGAQQMPKNQPPVWSAKPDIAAFEKVENDRVAGAQQTLDRLLGVTGARTVENTLVPYDEVNRQLNTAGYLANVVEKLHPDKNFRDSARAIKAKINSVRTSLSLNPAVYRALVSMDAQNADSATGYYVQHELLEFRLNGVDKDDATRATLKKLREQLALDQTMFQRNIIDDEKFVEATPDELDGLPQDFIENHKPGADGRIRIPARDPDAFTVMNFAKDDSLRRRLWDASQDRGYPKNREVLLRMLQARHKIATLLGYQSWADYQAADKMIKSGANIARFLDELHAASRPVAQREFALELAEKRKLDADAKKIFSYEFFRLSELVRHAQYGFDSQSVRPYLPYPEVKQGVMSTAAALFHVSFKQEMNVPAWHQSVETWDVIDNGKAIGRFYLDLHPRPGKRLGGAMSVLLDGVRGKQLPEGVLQCNFPEPTATDPGLMDYNDLVTFFHEFGHLMHHILGGQQPWAGIGATSVETDFVEVPSQMLEEWMLSPQVLASFARHYKTHEPIPADLVLRMRRALSFGAANLVEFQTMLAAVSYDLHKQNPENIDPDATMINDMQRSMLLTPVASDAHRYANFGHLGTGDFSSAFYTYLWDRVIAEDFFEQFAQNNLLTGDAPPRYRRTVLEPGGSMPANDLVKHFLGRPQNTIAFQHWMEREFKPAPSN
ncbi:MAG: M3 family metallopeptidase [Terriglobales bacterium]